MKKKQILKLAIIVIVIVITVIGVYFRNTRDAEPGLGDLPEGIIATTSSFQVTQSDLDEYLASSPGNRREIKSRDLEGLLQEIIERRLLLINAKKLPKEDIPDTEGLELRESEDAFLEALENHVKNSAEVPENSVREYYEKHRSEYEGQPGGSYEEMHDSIADYLRFDIADEAFMNYKELLVAEADVSKSRKWIRDVREKIKDPLAKERGAGKIIIADFGRGI